jgi:hypothetical protein
LAHKRDKKDKERLLQRYQLPRLNKRKIAEIKHGLLMRAHNHPLGNPKRKV